VIAALLVALSLVAAALVILALRMDPVPNAGAVLTPEPQDHSANPAAPLDDTPTPSSGEVKEAGQVRFLSAASALFAIRAEAGDCGRLAPELAVTEDQGLNWAPLTLPAEYEIGQVLSVEAVDANQIDLIVLAGANCDVNVLTSFTGGQFWEFYPERLTEASYFDPKFPTEVTIQGAAVPSPCEIPRQLAAEGDEIALRCDDFVAVFDLGTRQWGGISPLNARSIAWDANRPGFVAAALDPADECPTVPIVRFPTDGSALGGVNAVCAPAEQSQLAEMALEFSGGILWLWVGDGVLTSADGGATWVDL
jgi:hypothetical protein